MKQKDIDRFAELLEKVGYAEARELIQDELIPLAKKEHISLYEAARKYANYDEEQDTSWFQLANALLQIPKSLIDAIDIHGPL